MRDFMLLSLVVLMTAAVTAALICAAKTSVSSCASSVFLLATLLVSLIDRKFHRYKQGSSPVPLIKKLVSFFVYVSAVLKSSKYEENSKKLLCPLVANEGNQRNCAFLESMSDDPPKRRGSRAPATTMNVPVRWKKLGDDRTPAQPNESTLSKPVLRFMIDDPPSLNTRSQKHTQVGCIMSYCIHPGSIPT